MIYHISHIDLDGYGCQIVTEKYYGEGNVKFYNCNYGNSIIYILESILQDIRKTNEQNTLIITDIDLSLEIAKLVDDKFYKNGIEVILIDHHKTGSIVAEKYPWYNLNLNYCATKLTQMYFKVKELEEFSNYVNVQDLQFNSHPLFSQANFIGDIAYKGYEFPNIIEHENFKYKMFTIKAVFDKFTEGYNIRDIQRDFIEIQENYLAKVLGFEFVKDKTIPIEHKFVVYIFSLIKNIKFPTLNLDNSKCRIMFDFPPNVFQQMAFLYLEEYSSIDMLILVNPNGRVSIRSIGTNPKKDTSIIATKYFNGGGHANSAGGSIYGNDLSKIIKSEFECVEILKNLYNNALKTQLVRLDNSNAYLDSIKEYYNGELYKFNKQMFILFERKDTLVLKNIENENEYVVSLSNNLELVMEHFKNLIEKDSK